MRRSRTTLRLIIAAGAVLAAGCAPGPATPPTTSAPPATSTPTTAPVATTVPGHGAAPGVHVDETRIPRGSAGSATPRIGAASYSKTPGDGTGSFRVNCQYSHMRFDDPIVFPGRPRAAHLHTFAGNTDVTAASTAASVTNSGSSTCTGGTANRSAYWAPTVIDTSTGTPLVSGGDSVDHDNFLQVYYKTGYDGVAPATVQNFPAGLRMIAGSATSTRAQDGIVWYTCEGPGGTTATSTSFPRCAPGELFVMVVEFPQCWDGVNLDSPDHKSHMAYGAGWPDRGCPASHPVPLAQITQHWRYRVPAAGMATWRLSSDMYDGPAGYSGHADWMNGWDPAVFQRVVDNCYRGGFDCSMNLLGDGWMLQ